MRFTRSVQVPGRIELVSAFHQDPHNIGRVSPFGISVEIISARKEARPGEEFLLRVRQFGFPMRWQGKWETVELPHRLVDTAKIFPFSKWRHEHQFAEDETDTVMTDRVQFRLPWYLGGRLVETFFVYPFFLWMFAVRHRNTVRLFSGANSIDYV